VTPTQHPSNNDVLGAPPGISIEEVRPLAITRVSYPDGTQGVVSFWRPSAEQLALMNSGRCVWLSVLGHPHPPVMLGVDGDGRFEL
jgi:hypothetical protein